MIINKNLPTDFDFPERLSDDEIIEQHKRFNQSELIEKILENYPDIIIVLNKYRQIVGWNNKTEEFFNISSYDLLGKRFAESINCIHLDANLGGCGTSKFCKECGTAKAIKYTNENGKSITQECRITVNEADKEKSFDFKVRTTKINLEDDVYIFLSIKDISDEKRRHALEKIFFHDVLNTGSAINGLAYMIKDEEDKVEIKYLSSALVDSSEQLIHEIQAQKDLTFAEKGELEVNIQSVGVNEILGKIAELYSSNGANKLKIDYLIEDIALKSDPVILIRSLGNLVKNAFEASNKNEFVEIYIEDSDYELVFNIKNQQVIPEKTQLQIFKRSFSTKSKKGRGIGTYSVKLLIEQYLGGKVYFVSNEKDCTVFSIKLKR